MKFLFKIFYHLTTKLWPISNVMMRVNMCVLFLSLLKPKSPRAFFCAITKTKNTLCCNILQLARKNVYQVQNLHASVDTGLGGIKILQIYNYNERLRLLFLFFFHFVMLINNNVLPRLNLLPGKSSTLYARSGSVFGLVCCCRCFGFLLLFLVSNQTDVKDIYD